MRESCNGSRRLNFFAIDFSSTVSIAGSLENDNFLSISYFGAGGNTLNISGTLTNNSTFNVASRSDVVNLGGLINNGTVTNSGTVESNFTLNNNTISNTGTVLVPSQAKFSNGTGASYMQSSGATVVDGLFTSSTAIQIKGGKLSGNGTIHGDVEMGGTLSPGESPGTLTINGNYTQLAGGTFDEEITLVSSAIKYDRLIVNGAVSLDGTLVLQLLGFVPTLGSTFEFLTFTPDELTGTFSDIKNYGISNTEMWKVIYNNPGGYAELEAARTPEPASVALLSIGLAGIAGMLPTRLRRRTASAAVSNRCGRT